MAINAESYMQYCCINMYILWVWHKILTLTFSIFHVTLFGVILHLSVIVLLLTVSFVDRLAVTSVYYVFCIVSLNSRTVIVRILPSRLHFPRILSYAHTHTHPFNSPLSGTTQVVRYLKGKTNLDFTEARDSEWQLHQLDHIWAHNELHQTAYPVVRVIQKFFKLSKSNNGKHKQHTSD